MDIIVAFVTGIATGAVAYRYLYAEKYRGQEISCNEKEKEKELYRQLERLMAYSGKE